MPVTATETLLRLLGVSNDSNQRLLKALALTTWRLMVGEILLDSQKWKLVL